MILGRSALLLFILISLPAWSAEFVIPLENSAVSDPKKMLSFESKAQKLVGAIQDGKPQDVDDLFFPAAPFEKLKGRIRPLEYHAQLVAWFHDDVARENTRFLPSKKLEFKGFKLGFCKWKEKGSETNLIPYYSCYRSKITVDADGKKETIVVKTLINWGNEWFITHLGPIPTNKKGQSK